jgi:RNA polymerase sigma-70 factor (ECF subfamily)
MSRFSDINIDEAIVRRAMHGDSRAHAVLYRAFSTPVYSLCLRLTRVPSTAEDLLQETFIEVMRSIAGFRGEASLGGWIRRIALSKCLMFLRSSWHSKGQSLEDDWEDGPASVAGSEQRHGSIDNAMDLDAALGNLPSISRTIVWLHDVEGYTHKEIADLMGKSESFSKSQLSRAYQRLRLLLEQADREACPDSVEGLLPGGY